MKPEIYVPSWRGCANPEIMVVGEAPGSDEVEALEPFVGASGKELDTMLLEVGIDRAQCFLTNVCHYQPPKNKIQEFYMKRAQIQELKKLHGKQFDYPEVHNRLPDTHILEGLIELWRDFHNLRPKIVIALGGTALWALTGEASIQKWRGSPFELAPNSWLVPTYHPAFILREWSLRSVAMQDLRKASDILKDPREIQEPEYDFIIAPSAVKALGTLCYLREYKKKLSVDLETYMGMITCIGIAWSSTEAICIPLLDCSKPNWSFYKESEELAIMEELHHLLNSPDHEIIGQNYLYDAQYLALWLGVHSNNVRHDTMILHHTCFPAMRKSLDFLSSIYLPYHRYWKDEGRRFDPRTDDPIKHWTYNCKDAVHTYACHEVIENNIVSMGLEHQAHEQMSWFNMLLKTMLQGVRIDTKQRNTLLSELMACRLPFEQFFKDALPKEVLKDQKVGTKAKNTPWWRSPPQQAHIFYDELGIKPVINRKTGMRTVNDSALETIGEREPLVRHVTDSLAAYRSLGTITSVLMAGLDTDQRMRCSYNPAGTDTFRLSSSANAFDSGTNIQNITTGEKYAGKEPLKRLPFEVHWPNLRKLFIPDRGCYMADLDQARADAQVVAWEAEDQILKQMFREGADIHAENAKAIWGERITQSPHFVGVWRWRAKQGVHAVDYGAKARTLAKTLGCTVHEADQFINGWFGAHPEIKGWHKRVEMELMVNKAVSNKFGYRINFFQRIEDTLPAALAWIPQSTVAIVTNKIWKNIVDNIPWVDILLQGHDSLVFQFPITHYNRRHEIEPHTRIIIPYDDPLSIPVGLKLSTKSWGDCEKASWK